MPTCTYSAHRFWAAFPLGAAVCLAVAVLPGSLPAAEAVQDPGVLIRAAERFVHQNTRELSGDVDVHAGPVDSRLTLPRCAAPEITLAPGAKLWGNGWVTARCREPAWSIQVPVKVRVTGPALFSARPLSHGQTIAEADVQLQTTDLTQLPGGALTALDQAVGKVMNTSVAANLPLRPEMLRAPFAVRQGQPVKLVASGEGFSVSADGIAQGNAAVGQGVTVKARSGRVVQGIVQPDGSVAVR